MRDGQLCLHTKLCLGCNKKFTTIDKDQETCGTECYLKWFKPKLFAVKVNAESPDEEPIEDELDLLVFTGDDGTTTDELYGREEVDTRVHSDRNQLSHGLSGSVSAFIRQSD
jgi:hypothetical protein